MSCCNMGDNSFQVLFAWEPFHPCHGSPTIEMIDGIQQID
jgi:hypothetical protein